MTDNILESPDDKEVKEKPYSEKIEAEVHKITTAIYESDEGTLSNTIYENLMGNQQNGNLSKEDRVKAISQLENETLQYGISRLEGFIQKIQFIGLFSLFLSVTVLIITLMSDIFIDTDGFVGRFSVIIIGLIVVAVLLYCIFVKDRQNINRYVFFKKLLELEFEKRLK